MSKIWRELADPKVHSDFMSSYNEGGVPVKKSRDNLLEQWVYFVNVCGFTFQFVSIEQIIECKAYFVQKVHPSTRDSHPPSEHFWHPWYCKLPKGLNKTSNRKRVLKALDCALQKWS
ncbi:MULTISPECIES: hypothetical protein [Vibrio]|uniref:hypothetical protein n=1 Tax=Vibrio TaxID=662 RepID=UPI00058750A3|nr:MULTISPECIES: hypothetical protein [Vibrio]MDE3895987.1 hypothetical protein [Vibrio sp. CC007]QFT36141.1 hypothetical protein FIU99_06835 [Vibrio sp. THAF64]QGM34041.1 hypothetical protein GGC04_06845 [Vibrio sp. THAF191d]QGN69543.1 hypothetical protein GGC03_06850 [Vibrio sp. THAF191c]